MEEKKPNTLLRLERELKGWSQKALAARVGTNEQSVNHWESGLHKPSKYFQAQLCQLYGKSAEELGFMHKPEMTNEKKEGALASPSAPIPLAGHVQRHDFPPDFSLSATQDIMAETEQFQNKAYPGRDSMRTRRQMLHHLLMIGSTALVLSPYAILPSDGAGLLHLAVIEELETIT